METIFHPANERGHANHGWLDAHHSFSFASWQNPEKVHFGVLRVLNDDVIAAGRGFGAHPHDNMEIITIPLSGALEHNDNTGRNEIIRSGDVQLMSAGTGITHSEYNASEKDAVSLLQIWVFPKLKNIKPKYQQITFQAEDFLNQLKLIVSPIENDNVLLINQDAWFSIGNFDKETQIDYNTKKDNNGVYIFVIDGTISINNNQLNKRDGFGLFNTKSFDITIEPNSKILIMDIPMKIN
jgi:redox-sensitive bicupin YhaK (pirin superfamily)